MRSSYPTTIAPLMITTGERRPPQRRRRRVVDPEPLLRALPSVAHAVDAGRAVRIVGPRNLLDGIADGSLHYLKGAEGNYGVVADTNNQIVGSVQSSRTTRSHTRPARSQRSKSRRRSRCSTTYIASTVGSARSPNW
jgi:hypothetical protein